MMVVWGLGLGGIAFLMLNISLVSQTALLRDSAYRLEIISASLLKGLVYLAGMTCSVDLQIL